MRKISILLTFVLMFSLCSCKKVDEAANHSDIVASMQTSSKETSSKATSEEISSEATSEENSSEITSEETSSETSEETSSETSEETSSKTESEETSSKVTSEETSSKNISSKKSQTTSSKAETKECKHKISAISVAATCTQNGRLVKKCSLCEYSEEKTIEAKGHLMISGKCANCNYADTEDNVKTVAEWIMTNANGKYVLPDDNYYIRSNGRELFFNFKDEEGTLSISVYGRNDNLCHLEYQKGEVVEGDLPTEWVYSSNRKIFESMRGPNDSELKSKMIEEMASKIDMVLKNFDNALKEKLNISIVGLGFTGFELEE